MVEAALRATDFAVNATSRRWMKAALATASNASKSEPFASSSKHANEDEQPKRLGKWPSWKIVRLAVCLSHFSAEKDLK
jgi:hypothetical protein